MMYAFSISSKNSESFSLTQKYTQTQYTLPYALHPIVFDHISIKGAQVIFTVRFLFTSFVSVFLCTCMFTDHFEFLFYDVFN